MLGGQVRDEYFVDFVALINGLVVLTNVHLVELVHYLSQIGLGRAEEEKLLGDGNDLVLVSQGELLLSLGNNERLVVEKRCVTVKLVQIQFLMVF